MKSIIQKSLVIALVYYAVAISSCLNKQCNCSPAKIGKFRYTQITSNNLTYTFPTNQTFSTAIDNSDTIVKSEFGIRFLFDYTIAYQKQKRTNGISLMNNAYACSCAEDNFTSSETIKNISIKTILDFDAFHLAGSDVTDCFSRLYQSYSPSSIKYEPAFIASYYDFYQQYTSTGTKSYDLYLKNSAITSKNVAFELIIEYTNGKTISAKTKALFLK